MRFFNKMSTLVLLISCVLPFFSAAQHSEENFAFRHGKHRCVVSGQLTDEQKEKQAFLFRQWRQQRIGATSMASLPVNSEGAGSTYTIPVVVHIFEETQGTTHTNVAGAIAALNDAFAHVNAFNVNQGVDTGIKFCLAQRAPDGGITSGINRIKSDYVNVDMDLEDSKLKTTLQWDPRHYLNIWVIDELYSELDATYTGRGGWDRRRVGGYATLPGAPVGLGAFRDGVVVSGMATSLLAHEVGHYLGLLHTFEGGCANGDCLTNGDMICDTPPDNDSGGGCGGNSCKTDTLSNYSNGFFPMDVPDMTTNFMDYSSCQTDFTAGQRDRMHFHLDNYRSVLDVNFSNVCNKPCNGSAIIDYITPGDSIIATGVPITFTSTGSGTNQYEWYVEKLGGISSDYSVAMPIGYTPTTATVANTKDLTHTFATEGKYRVYLKAWDIASPTCFASYSEVVRVTCAGVDARFWPDKRLIASKQTAAKFLDSVRFGNLSQGANNYLWTITHEPPDLLLGTKLPDFTSTAVDLTYTFPEPGTYQISLEAFNGACSDKAGPFELKVLDPTMNGIPKILRADCLNEDSIKVRLRIANTGYDTVNIGTPVSFYDEDPRQASPPAKLLTTFLLPKEVYGYDSPREFDVKMKGSRLKLDQLFVVFNDTGSVSFPLTFVNADKDVTSDLSQFPPSGFNELRYTDNFASKRDFQFKLILAPLADTTCAFSDYQILAETKNDGGKTTALWTPGTNLSCSDCLDPILRMRDQMETQKLLVTSDCGCTDSATVVISPFPYDAPLVTQPPEICQYNPVPSLSTFVTGQDLIWYDQARGGTGTNQAPVVNGDIEGLYEFWISQTVNGCEGPREKFSLTVKPAPPPQLGIVPDVCLGVDPPDVAAAVAGTNLLWYDTANGGTGTSSPPNIRTDVPGTFSLWVSQVTDLCESPRVMLTYNVVDLPSAPLVADTVHVCQNDAVPDLASYVSGSNLRWYADPSTDAGSVDAPVFDTDLPANFSYFVTQTVNGCEGPSTEVFVQVNSMEIMGRDAYEIDEGESVELSVSLATLPNQNSDYSVQWKDASGTAVGNTLTTEQRPIESTVFTAEVTTAEGCISYHTAFVKVIMKLRPSQIFTPNGDGSNEQWHVGFLNQFPKATITVYNRWGNPVFKETNYQNDWQGDHNGAPLPIGTYYFVVDLSAYEREAVTGSLTIMR